MKIYETICYDGGLFYQLETQVPMIIDLDGFTCPDVPISLYDSNNNLLSKVKVKRKGGILIFESDKDYSGCKFEIMICIEESEKVSNREININEMVCDLANRQFTVVRSSYPLCIVMTDDGKNHDNVNHPSHYTSHPSGIECIEITKHHDFCIGNAIKYLWRSGLKHEDGMDDKVKQIEDLQKAIWYINKKIEMLEEK